MQWDTKKSVFAEPGEKELIRRFAWTPVDLGSRKTCWLEFYFEEWERIEYDMYYIVNHPLKERSWILKRIF